MDAQQKKRVGQLFVTAVTLDRLRGSGALDEAGARLLADTVAEISEHSGATVIEAALRWQADGMLRRDPRPRETITYDSERDSRKLSATGAKS